MSKTLTRFLLLPLLIILCAGLASAGTTYNLSADWSDTQNPNGVWQYLSGTTNMNSFSDWMGTGNTAWAVDNNCCDWVPALFKWSSSGTCLWPTPAGCDWAPGDVVGHTWDPFNGGLNGPLNILWTSPGNGTIDISGLLWNATQNWPTRSNDWYLLVNGTQVDSGHLAPGDGHTSSNPWLFSDNGFAVSGGDTVELLLQSPNPDAGGDFIGMNIIVDYTPSSSVPEPGTVSLLVVGFGLSRLFRRVR